MKQFHYYEHRTTSLREWFIRTVARKPVHIRRPVFTLTDLHLSLRRGESLALVGPNGSGKSTVLRLLAGIYAPTRGSIVTRGCVGSVIELGSGFHPELTGAENAELYTAIMGMTYRQLRQTFGEIAEFADIGDFMNMPVKYYSSGMRARLAFAIAICGEPDIFLLDEVLAVGDAAFSEKCLARVRRFHERGGTLVVVSHSIEQLYELCSSALWLENGTTRRAGDAAEVLNAYRASSVSAHPSEQTPTASRGSVIRQTDTGDSPVWNEA